MIDFLYAGLQLHKAAQEKDSTLGAWITVSAGHVLPYAQIFFVDTSVKIDGGYKILYYEHVNLYGNDWEKGWAEAINRTYAAIDAYLPEKKEGE